MSAITVRFAVCTTVARNYLAHARVLAASFSRHHAGSRLLVLVIDELGSEDASGEPFDLVRPADLDLPPGELHRLAGMYGPKELSTALKPWLLRLVLERGYEVALFVDPDMEVFAPLDEAAAATAQHGVALTPHTVAPIPLDGKSPTELELAASGVYNTGFIGVAPEARAFLDWWAERLSRHSVIDPRGGLFVDQRWVDWVPSYFPHVLLRDPGYNVAHWNLHERRVQEGPGGYEVEGRPLRLFHFSGFDPERPHLLTGYGYGYPPRILLSAHPTLARLCSRYAEQLLASGYRTQLATPYAWSTAVSGRALDATTRALYRYAVLAAERGAEQYPPDPFEPQDGDRFAAWASAWGATRHVPPEARAALYLNELETELVAPPQRTRLERLARRALGRDERHAKIDRALLDALGSLATRLEVSLTELRERVLLLERDRKSR